MGATAATGLLRSPLFDLSMIAGIPLLALASGLLVAYNNDLFLPVLAADLWLLGYHHVISTYTRLAFDKQGFAEHKALVIYLLPLVAALVGILAVLGGVWLITTIYLHWQWWHYTRQSEGISKAYARKSGAITNGPSVLGRLAFYSVPALGILTVSHRSPATFLFARVETLPVPGALLSIAQIVVAILVACWLIEQAILYRANKTSVPYLGYVLSHFVIYYFAYIHFEEINFGWLTINIWHNAQYILFVWLYNNRRYNGRPEASRSFLAAISQDGRFLLYIASCLTITSAVYVVLISQATSTISNLFAVSGTLAALIVYQSLNFHHYIVDSLIWKLRKPQIQATLKLSET